MNNTSGVLERIWIKRAHRGPMDSRDRAALRAGIGIDGGVDRSRVRQVTIISRERWDALMEELGVHIDPSARRANLMISGIDLDSSRGRVLRIGACRLRIHGETRPCERMDDAQPGLRGAMRQNWSGGVFGEVLDDGEIHVGDAVHWVEDA